MLERVDGGVVFVLNKVCINAAAAMNVFTDFGLSPSCMQLCSPTIWRNRKSAKGEVNSNVLREISTVGMVKLHLAKVFPKSVTLMRGDTTGETPPSRSCSAKLKQILISYNVSPPKAVAINTPSCTRES